MLLGTSAKSDYDLIENQLVAPQGGGRQGAFTERMFLQSCGSYESAHLPGELCNDILYLLRPDVNLQTPLPLPPFIDVVDKAILLFGKVSGMAARFPVIWVDISPPFVSFSFRCSLFSARISIASSCWNILLR